ncbi:hypothetical protein [Pseudonocardia lacus]|uniref:hypothetical protein n=1 Tax=Pseudonocardia lacus TaxID=2835865 RepID=UPI001BDBD42D|nr:hypothetical protein [Pseudonocardia lacus]
MSFPLPPPQQGPPTQQQGPRHRSVPAPRTATGRRAEPRGADAPEDVELDSYLAALAPTTDDPSLTAGFGNAQVFQLRLPALRIEQLRRIAEERGVSPGALAVDWVIDRLDREDTPTGPFAVVAEAEKRRRSPLGKLSRRSRRGD